MSNVQKIFYDLPTVADVLSGAFYHCFYCSFRCVFFRPTLKPILGAKLSENRRDPSRHRVDHFPIDRARAKFGLWIQFKPGAIRIAICSFRLLSASI